MNGCCLFIYGVNDNAWVLVQRGYPSITDRLDEAERLFQEAVRHGVNAAEVFYAEFLCKLDRE